MEIKLNSTSENQTILKQLIRKDGGISNVYMLKTDTSTRRIRISKTDFTINYIDPVGGPRIAVGKTIRDTDLPIVKEIVYNKNLDRYIITFEQ